MKLSELIKDKLNDHYCNLMGLQILVVKRMTIIRKFDTEYSKIVKSVYEDSFGSNWKVRSIINESSKMKKYQKELNDNKEYRKNIHKKLSTLKKEIKILNDANSKLQ